MKIRMLKSLRTVELFKILAINILSVDQGKDDSLNLVLFLDRECSSNVGLLSSLELSRAKCISVDAELFDDLDAEGLNFRGDTIFLSGVRDGFVNGEEFKTLLNLRGEAGMIFLFLTGDVVIVGKGGSGNGSVAPFSKNEARTMRGNGQKLIVRSVRINQHFWKSKLLSYQKSSTRYTLRVCSVVTDKSL